MRFQISNFLWPQPLIFMPAPAPRTFDFLLSTAGNGFAGSTCRRCWGVAVGGGSALLHLSGPGSLTCTHRVGWGPTGTRLLLSPPRGDWVRRMCVHLSWSLLSQSDAIGRTIGTRLIKVPSSYRYANVLC